MPYACHAFLCYEQYVHPSVCNVGGLWLCSATKSINPHDRFDRICWCLGYLHAKADRDHSSLLSKSGILLRKTSGVYKNMSFCISVATICASNGSHVTLPQHLLSFFFICPLGGVVTQSVAGSTFECWSMERLHNGSALDNLLTPLCLSPRRGRRLLWVSPFCHNPALYPN